MLDPNLAEGLAFDDVLLKPGYSEILPSAVNTETRVTRSLGLKIPLMASAMDTVTEARLAIALAQLGGIGVVHKNMPVDLHAKEIRKVKRFESGLIAKPITVRSNMAVAEVITLGRQHGFTSFPVVDEGPLVGIVTGRDLRAVDRLDAPISVIMTKDLITVSIGTAPEEARRLMHRHRKETLPIIDDQGHLAGMFTLKDVEKDIRHPNAVTDSHGRLLVGAAVGVGPDRAERAAALVEAEVDLIVVDTAHGHTKGVIEAVRSIKKAHPEVQVMAGNVATGAGTEALIDAGADAIKVGIGPGSICTTRIIAGVGVPQISAVSDCSAVAKKHNIPLISDGGVKYSGDIVKAIAAGADAVMIGSLLAGVSESPGETVLFEGRAFKAYRGMGSLGAMQQGSADRYGQAGTESTKLVPEGIEGRVPFKGPLEETVWQLVGGLRAGMGYVGAAGIGALQEKAHFVRISASGLRESHVHDVVVTKESPNYTR